MIFSYDNSQFYTSITDEQMRFRATRGIFGGQSGSGRVFRPPAVFIFPLFILLMRHTEGHVNVIFTTRTTERILGNLTRSSAK